MPPKRVGGGRSNKGFLSSTYETFTSSENASVVLSVAIFGVCLLNNRFMLPSSPTKRYI
ncbi:hypothetical protein F4781DRAFT_413787 [Annulohypoxylon bovei var. microspora]|nr:hypothetical protein F4781DRAFT_413787 [Annulohypoxylon bovei var. microspora]